MSTLRSWLVLALAAIAVASLGLVACGSDDDGGGDPTATSIPEITVGDDEPAFLGVQVSPQPRKPDFVLTDTSGEDYDITAETEGYLTLLYVGYTHCPDVCPTHMLDIARTLDDLGPEIADRVKVVFVTSDPERDTPEAMRTWLDAFDERFIGLTGDTEDLENLQRQLGMNPAQKVPLNDKGDYAVDHGAYVLAFTAEDNLAHLVYPLGVTRDAWAHDIKKLVEEGWTES
ncbi:MAG: SCO family protein [Dehalococcoidia bacterium]|nr:SCO family protein [Dehalococcoidia bacterium]